MVSIVTVNRLEMRSATVVMRVWWRFQLGVPFSVLLEVRYDGWYSGTQVAWTTGRPDDADWYRVGLSYIVEIVVGWECILCRESSLAFDVERLMSWFDLQCTLLMHIIFQVVRGQGRMITTIVHISYVPLFDQLIFLFIWGGNLSCRTSCIVVMRTGGVR